MSTHRLLACAAAALGLSWCAIGPAQAGADPEPTRDEIIVGKDNALWSLPATGGEARPLFDLPWAATDISRLRVASNGSALLLTAKGFTAWAALRPSVDSELHFVPCSGASALSADGSRVVCATQDARRIAVYTLRPALDVQIIDRQALGPLFFGEGEAIVTSNDQGELLAISQEQSRVASGHQPARFLEVTPDGRRALGTYDEGTIDVVYTFRLDGKAARRTLVHAARNLSISADSAWAAIQQEVDACAVRIAGGQYMCWRRYRALDVSSRGLSLLMTRANPKAGHDLFLGAVSGTRARRPALVMEGVSRIAAFWPAASGAGTQIP